MPSTRKYKSPFKVPLFRILVYATVAVGFINLIIYILSLSGNI